MDNIKAPKNGYAYIYISNQSNNDVFFDNLQAGIVQGNIAEENHYYAYGLKIATLSSKKLGDVYEGSLKNNYLYQGAYSELDDDIGWNDFALRNYDAQIGRWVQQDPYQEFASPYIGMGNDPVNLVDPSGGSILDGLSGVERVVATTIAGAFIGGVAGMMSGDDDFTGALIGAGVGLAAGLGSLVKQITLSMGIQTAKVATTVINTPITTPQTGRQVVGANDDQSGSVAHGPNNNEEVKIHNRRTLKKTFEETLTNNFSGMAKASFTVKGSIQYTEEQDDDGVWSIIDWGNSELSFDIYQNLSKIDKLIKDGSYTERYYDGSVKDYYPASWGGGTNIDGSSYKSVTVAATNFLVLTSNGYIGIKYKGYVMTVFRLEVKVSDKYKETILPINGKPIDVPISFEFSIRSRTPHKGTPPITE